MNSPPHGHPLPSEADKPLAKLKKGDKAIIISLGKCSPHERGKLMSLGLMPGAMIHLLQCFPAYVVDVGFTQLALDKETATLIVVHKGAHSGNKNPQKG